MHFSYLIGWVEAYPATTAIIIFLLGALAGLAKLLFSLETHGIKKIEKRSIKTDGGKYVEGDDNSINGYL